MSKEKTQFLSLMFIDIPNASSVADTEGQTVAREMVEHCISIISVVRKQHGGNLIRTVGSSLLCSFPHADQAIEAACAMQDAIANTSTKSLTAPTLRIGLHAGNAILQHGSYTGEVVTTAARMVTLAKTGQIVASGDIHKKSSPKSAQKLSPLENASSMESRLNVTLFEVNWHDAISEGPLPEKSTAAKAEAEEPKPASQPPAKRVIATSKPESAATTVSPTPVKNPPEFEIDLSQSRKELVTAKITPPASSADRSKPANAAPPATTPPPHLNQKKKTHHLQPPKKKKVILKEVVVKETVPAPPPPEEDSVKTAAPATSMRLCLIHQGNVLTVDKEHPAISMGRDSSNEIVITVDTASRHHAEVKWRDNNFYLIDHSGNGTFAYDEQGKEIYLLNDEITLPLSGAICPGCPQDEVECEALLYWIAE